MKQVGKKQEKKRNLLSSQSNMTRHLTEADRKKGGFSGTTGVDPYPPVPRDWRDKCVISGRKQNWRPGAQKISHSVRL